MSVLEWHLIGALIVLVVVFIWIGLASSAKRAEEYNAVLWKLRKLEGWSEGSAMGMRIQIPPAPKNPPKGVA